METAVAAAARHTAEDDVPFALRDVEDLHDADLDAVLGDRLADAGAAVDAVGALAELVREPGPAVFAHTLTARSLLLAVL
ncbi:hypothetical protein [Blastococcus deserti]|uniref:Uncharacterized protein n=1 Tax=Blastococcus deserti TaxID=2259033 RepID=A0ABW4XGJ6_9ACTN